MINILYKLIPLTKTLESIQFAVYPPIDQLLKSDITLLKNSVSYQDFSLNRISVDAHSKYIITPNQSFSESDSILIQLVNNDIYSNQISIIFKSSVESGSAYLPLTLPLVQGTYVFTLDKINNIEMNLFTDPLDISYPISPSKSSLSVYNKAFTQIAGIPFDIESKLITTKDTPVIDGIYDIEFLIEEQ